MSLRSSSGGEKSIEKEKDDNDNGRPETNTLKNSSKENMTPNTKNTGVNISFCNE